MSTNTVETIIDCDIHQRLPNVKVLYPYLSTARQRDIDAFGLRLPSPGYLNGGDRGYRHDSWPDDGAMVGSDLDLMRKQLLDVYPIEYGILLGQEIRGICALPDVDYANDLARAYNQWMIDEWLERDERLKGALIVPTQSPQMAAREIQRHAAHPDVVGVLVANGTRIPYGQRFYDPIFEACVEHGFPFVLHTGGEGTGINGTPTPVGHPSYYVEHRQARPMGYMGHIASMVFEGLFERFPDLAVVFVEGGYTWLPTYLWRLDADWRGLRNQTPWVKRAPSEYVLEHCKFTSQPMEMPTPLSQLMTVFEWADAANTLMFASDYPHWDFDSPELSLPRMPDEMARNVFSETARKVFNLPARVAAAV
jgi:predicted TIM-barrel fold metal-dependent hydrolase